MKKYILLALPLLFTQAALAGYQTAVRTSTLSIFMAPLMYAAKNPNTVLHFLNPLALATSKERTSSIHVEGNFEEDDEDRPQTSNITHLDAMNGDYPIARYVHDNILAMRQMANAIFFPENRITVRTQQEGDQVRQITDGPFADREFGVIFTHIIGEDGYANFHQAYMPMLLDAFRANLLLMANNVIQDLEQRIATFDTELLLYRGQELMAEDLATVNMGDIDRLITAVQWLREMIYQRPHIAQPNGRRAGFSPLIATLDNLENDLGFLSIYAFEVQGHDIDSDDDEETYQPFHSEALPLWNLVREFQVDQRNLIRANNLEALLRNYEQYLESHNLYALNDEVLDELSNALDSYIDYTTRVNNFGLNDIFNEDAHPHEVSIVSALEILGEYFDSTTQDTQSEGDTR